MIRHPKEEERVSRAAMLEMWRDGVSQADIARLAGVTRNWVWQVLSQLSGLCMRCGGTRDDPKLKNHCRQCTSKITAAIMASRRAKRVTA